MAQISVIVPVYKAEDYLHECVDSILGQSWEDLEVFLVDDGSPDGCGAICEEYREKDSRVRVIHQENQGQAAARNHALAQARGEWICFVDSDDVVHPGMLQMLHRAAVSAGAGISMCQMVESPRMPGDFLRQREERAEVLEMDEETLLRLFDAGEYPAWVACAKLIRRELVESYPFREGRVYEDNEAVCRWVVGAGKLVRIPEDLYFYRTNPVSTTQRAFSLKKLDYLWALESIIRFYHRLGYRTLADRFCALYAEEAAGQYRRIARDMDRPDVLKRLKAGARKLDRDVGLGKKRKELLLDTFHPRLIRYYWPIEGAVRTLREAGAAGLAAKIRKNLRREEEG